MAETEGNNSYGKRPLWHWIVIYLVIGAVVYAGVYYLFLAKKGGYSQNQNQDQTGQYQAPSSTPTAAESVAPSSVQEIMITGNEFAFAPSIINIKQGETVKITFKNIGKYPHNFTISDLNIQTKTIKAGEQDSVQFTADKAGSFSYVCTVGSHADKGMKGILVVQ